MKECLLGGKLRLSSRTSQRRPAHVLDAGLDLSRKRLNVCLLSDHAEVAEEFGGPPHGVPVRNASLLPGGVHDPPTSTSAL